MWSLGLVMEHDASVALARDGEIVAAISEERLSRRKGQWGYPWRAIDECLRIGGISKEDIDVFSVALNKFPGHFIRRETPLRELTESIYRLKRKINGSVREDKTINILDFIKSLKGNGGILSSHFKEDVFKKEGFKKARVRIIDHHFAHALSALLYSGFEEAIVVTIDCEGPVLVSDYTSCHTLGSIFNRQLVRVSHTTGCFRDGLYMREFMTDSSVSPGAFYGHITEGLGFKPNRHEGKVTGLAAMGDSSRLYKEFREFLGINHDGSTFYAPFALKGYPNIGDAQKDRIKSLINGQRREDVASAAQKVLEDAVTEHIKWYAKRTGIRNLVLSGGVFANVKLNQRLMELKDIDNIFVFPAMTDTGLSVGAAIMPFIELDGALLRHIKKLKDVYLGPSFSNEEIKRLLENSGLGFEYMDDKERAKRVAGLVADGKVVGLFQGRMEFGPRALGNRSILALPTDNSINDWLNKRLGRSEFMPFAPSVLDFAAPDIFEDFHKAEHTSKFMTITFNVRKEWRKRIPAVVHVDGTARPQVVSKEDNPLYYEIIEEFYRITGLPVILNTSFNVHEEPIICRPEDAIKALNEDRVDVLVLENFLVRKDW